MWKRMSDDQFHQKQAFFFWGWLSKNRMSKKPCAALFEFEQAQRYGYDSAFPGLTSQEWVLMLSWCICTLVSNHLCSMVNMISELWGGKSLFSHETLICGVLVPKMHLCKHHWFDLNQIRFYLNAIYCRKYKL